jgi:hypothetical protein
MFRPTTDKVDICVSRSNDRMALNRAVAHRANCSALIGIADRLVFWSKQLSEA